MPLAHLGALYSNWTLDKLDGDTANNHTRRQPRYREYAQAESVHYLVTVRHRPISYIERVVKERR
ncbi:MAG: hypothetical protein LC808_20490 [Actinobacteria bacterium]|nr:hypothetical protein [Actinomycetota bacterium]